MSAQVIPRQQWMQFASWFSRRHHRSLVTAFWTESCSPCCPLLQNASLERLSFQLVERHAGLEHVPRAPGGLWLLADGPADRAWLEFSHDVRCLPRHEVVALSRVRFAQQEEAETLELESMNGAVLSLQLHKAAA